MINARKNRIFHQATIMTILSVSSYLYFFSLYFPDFFSSILVSTDYEV